MSGGRSGLAGDRDCLAPSRSAPPVAWQRREARGVLLFKFALVVRTLRLPAMAAASTMLPGCLALRMLNADVGKRIRPLFEQRRSVV
jgi:hypothetical protein